MPTILEELTKASVARDLNNDPAITGPNTDVDSAVCIEQWSEWQDFTYENIKTIFKKQLGLRYQGDREPLPLPQDLFIFNKDSTDDAMRRFPIPIVNYALSSAKGTEHFGRGSRCPLSGFIPDWSVVTSDHRDGKDSMNILPGDTKVSSKWTSEIVTDPTKSAEWDKVVKQVVTYMAAWSVRYGFIVTDVEVVVLRITRQYIPSGIAANRVRRASNATITLRSGSVSDPVSDPASDSANESASDLQCLRKWPAAADRRDLVGETAVVDVLVDGDLCMDVNSEAGRRAKALGGRCVMLTPVAWMPAAVS